MGTSATPPPAAPTTPSDIEQIAEGQKLVIYAILVYILAMILAGAVDQTLGLVGLGAAALAIVGLVRLARGMGWSTGVMILMIVLLFAPLISLIMLVIVNARATERLKAAGYKVGLLGARKPA